jgi:hypothetical protein
VLLTSAKFLRVLCNTAAYCNITFSAPLFVRQRTRYLWDARRQQIDFCSIIVVSVGQLCTQTSARTKQCCMRDASLRVSPLWHNVAWNMRRLTLPLIIQREVRWESNGTRRRICLFTIVSCRLGGLGGVVHVGVAEFNWFVTSGFLYWV